MSCGIFHCGTQTLVAATGSVARGTGSVARGMGSVVAPQHVGS